MTTTLPADPDTQRLAQRLAAARGKPLAAVVRDAIEAEAAAAGVTVTARKPLMGDELIARMTAISDHFASLPVLDPRTPDEIIGYDEHGIPR